MTVLKPNDDFSETDPTKMRDGTPQSAMVRFCYSWQKRDLNMMLDMCSPTWKAKPKAKEKLELWFGDLFLRGMKVLHVKKFSQTDYQVAMMVAFSNRKHVGQKPVVTMVKAHMICETGAGTWSINGKWGLKPTSILRALGVVGKIMIDPSVPM